MRYYEKGGRDRVLHPETVAGALRERDKVSLHQRVDVAEPALRDELVRVFVYPRVRVHHIGRHADGHLECGSIVLEFDEWEAKGGMLTPAGIVNSLYCSATSGETRGRRCMTP